VRKKFTLLELLIVVAIIGILISILLPSLTKARDSAKRAVCRSNQSQIYRGMMLYSHENNKKVILGGLKASLRYSMNIWDKHSYTNGRGGWMAFGYIYKANNFSSINSWDCPSRQREDLWQRPREEHWPPGTEPLNFVHSAYIIRSTSKYNWDFYKAPNFPFIAKLESNLTFMSDNFLGLPLYNDRHGKYKINQYVSLDGSAKITQGSAVHSRVLTLLKYNEIDNVKVEKLWQMLDEEQ